MEHIIDRSKDRWINIDNWEINMSIIDYRVLYTMTRPDKRVG
jgi:hypothetical protein